MKKLALITGASGGIGSEIAKCLHRDGYETLLHHNHSFEGVKALSDELGGAPLLRADFNKPDEIEAMFDLISSSHGGLDLLINNAGVAHYGLITDISPDKWRSLFAVNVDAVYHCCRLALPSMLQKKAGKIINIASIWGICGASCEVAYSASKAAVIGLTKALAKELGPSGINVNCIAPGVIMTEMLDGLSAEALEALQSETPLGRVGQPSDVAELVSFLASDKAGFITGQIISTNGGFLIS